MRPRADDAFGLLALWDGQAERTVRIGMLLPWANVAVEDELPRLGLSHTVFHYTRLVPASRTTAVDAAFWHGLRSAAAGGLDALSPVPLDAVFLACTSAGFPTGPAPPALPPGVLTAFDALTGVLTHLGVRRIVLATPYPQEVTAAEAAALAAYGIETTAHTSLGLADGYPTVTADQIRTLVRHLPPVALRTADAVVLSCTGWHTLPVLAELQQALGVPVFSSTLAMALYAARLAMGAPCEHQPK
ncbi:hypothetical protein AABB02_00160 [Streptomyces rimosus]|uniref:aspartate racemase/maleate isomerase family protein n=1 Tax=Streptomyces rimosus TaxID=1927 RepID=UPI0031D69C1A